jgi:hypothetical protein
MRGGYRGGGGGGMKRGLEGEGVVVERCKVEAVKGRELN